MVQKRESIRSKIFALLDENPLLSAKMIAKLADINYKTDKRLIWKYKSQWKTSLQNRKALNPKISTHRSRYWANIKELRISREAALKAGWKETGWKNKALIFRCPGLGHLVFFVSTGRVNMHIKKPVLKGRVFQLFCNGFSMTGLIDSIKVLEVALSRIKMKGAHTVFEFPERLPYMVIDLFKTSNGVIIRSGDESHPNALEVEWNYPGWAERNEDLLRDLLGVLNGGPKKMDKSPGPDPGSYYVA